MNTSTPTVSLVKAYVSPLGTDLRNGLFGSTPTVSLVKAYSLPTWVATGDVERTYLDRYHRAFHSTRAIDYRHVTVAQVAVAHSAMATLGDLEGADLVSDRYGDHANVILDAIATRGRVRRFF